MAYSSQTGRRPYERASKINHSEVINHPLVKSFVETSELPSPPETGELEARFVPIPKVTNDISRVVAIDGGMTEAIIRPEFPSASVAFFSMGPLLLQLDYVTELDSMPFIGPDDMSRLNQIQRYNLVLPVRVVRTKGEATFSAGVRRRIHEFLMSADEHLNEALRWLLFRGWKPAGQRDTWTIPRCPNSECSEEDISFSELDGNEKTCSGCGGVIFLSDALRLYERIDDEFGCGGILSYVLTSIEQIILVRLIKELVSSKSRAYESVLEEVCFIKDGPLAFFGTVAPLYQPMRELMNYLGNRSGRQILNLVGVEKSGPFVEHATLIEGRIPPNHAVLLDNEYIYRYITPGDHTKKLFGGNTYYGKKLIYRDDVDGTYVVTIPCIDYTLRSFSLGDLYNAARVLDVISRLRCSMYDNALLPVVLANKLVSLADAPSAEILTKFAKSQMG